MRIAVLAAQPVPFFFGGAQRLSAALVDWLDAAPGHSCTLVEIPSPERDLASLLQTYEECASLDLPDYDLVVSTKYPTWMVDHPNHVVYMIHPLRGLYETYRYFGLPLQPDRSHPAVARLLPLLEQPPDRDLLPELFAALHDVLAGHGSDDPAFAFPGPLARRLVHFLDRVGLDPEHVRAHWAISRTVANRPGYFPPTVSAASGGPPVEPRGPAPGRRRPPVRTGPPRRAQARRSRDRGDASRARRPAAEDLRDRTARG